MGIWIHEDDIGVLGFGHCDGRLPVCDLKHHVSRAGQEVK